MKNLSLALSTFLLLMLSNDILAQINNSVYSEYQNSLSRYKFITDYGSFQSKGQLNPNLDLTRTKFKKESQVNLQMNSLNNSSLAKNNLFYSNNVFQSPNKNSIMITNRRLKYSSLWAFASLNYLYADLVGIMDLNLLSQYQTGVVNGIEITPEFLTIAAAYMQIPLSNVFLPHIIKNDKTLRWIQIIAGTIATLGQGATLFVGKPAPYYILFTAIEMGATAYITIDAIKWKTKKSKNKEPIKF